MSATDFLRESARYLVNDRPDVYDEATAIEELSTGMDDLREYNQRVGVLSFTSYVLVRIYDWESGIEEYILARKMAGLLLAGVEGSSAYSYHDDIGLKSILDDDEDV